MIEPCSGAVASVACARDTHDTARRCATMRPTGTPASVSIGSRPKFASTSAPTVYGLPAATATREAEPMPPFRSKHDMPRPAPTAPRAKSRDALRHAAS